MRTLAVLLMLAAPAFADGPKDNVPDNVRPVPPKGVPVAEADAKELRAGLAELRTAIDDIPATFGMEHPLVKLIPDVEVYHKAVRYALDYDEMYADKKRDDVRAARELLKAGLQRAKELRDGKPSWTTATGYVVRGYRSRIDGSVQPYAIVVPKEYDFAGKARHRLDFWWHGRGELLTEMNFMANRQSASGIIPAAGAFIVFPYGRYCNANKFAGEIDTFECLENVRLNYRIDANKLVARGFSMGGAACWQFATHYPFKWAAAAPGAGFAETKEFLNDFQNEKVKPEWWEERLWRMYDATAYAQNLFNLPTVAYSSENDRQKQAADVMAREMKKVGLDLTHIIGPKTGHTYEAAAKAEVNRRIDAIVEKGREAMPKEIRFVTYTLRYNNAGWVILYAMEKQWSPASVVGKFADNKMTLETKGVTQLAVYPGLFPEPTGEKSREFPNGEWACTIDGQKVAFDRGAALFLASKVDGKWVRGGPRRDRPAKGGPIDDAFMSKFLFVRPTGKPLNEKVGAWADAEMKHAIEHWRKQFRGDAPVKDDKDVTADDINTANLILWGDPQSNSVMAKMADKLPVKWTKDGVVLGDKTYDAGTHVPALIYYNPLINGRYVVLNSGFTFREYDYLNNARQVPKLPDYAILDITTPPSSRSPGKIVRAGFFGEKWELLPDDGK